MSITKQQLKQKAYDAIDQHREEIIALGDSIFNEPELGYKEVKTARKVKEVFDSLGFDSRSEVAITGVVAHLKGKQNNVKAAVLGEMDAVISPTHTCSAKDTGAAHACGHNCMVAALVGVAYALGTTDVMSELSGDVLLMAVPAEEFVELEYRKSLKEAGKIHFIGGKQEMIRLGEFDDVDLVLMHHNGLSGGEGKIASAGYGSTGFIGKMINYLGKAAHAGATPHLGINALNAANLGLAAVSFQRETFQDKDNIRVHPIITKGGDLVNVVPDDVRIETYVRGANVEAILDANAKVTRAFKAGGDALGATTIIEDFPGYLPLNLCPPMMDLMYENMKDLFGEEKVCREIESMAGSTDAGDVSNIIPTLHAGFGGVGGTLHSSEFEIDDKDIAYIAPAKSIVATLIDLLWDDAQVGIEIKENFKAPMTKETYLKNWGKL